MRDRAGSAAAPAARCRSCRRGSFILNLPLPFTSFDYLVRAGEKRRRQVEPEGLGGLEIDDELELGRRLHRKIGRLGAFENAVDIRRAAPKEVGRVDAI